MKSFVNYLTESSYMRFLKKNKGLTDAERKEINTYFTKTNTQAASEIQWQDRRFIYKPYSYFEDIMLQYKSGFRKKLKINVPGKKGIDYWQIKLKNKSFLAYIPLTWEQAQYFNSSKFGVCETGHCIGWKEDSSYWDDHMIEEQEVPVYIVDGRGKWVVIIEDGNRVYQVWDKMNKQDLSVRENEPIDGFSIKKELLNSRVKNLYDDIREEFYGDENRRNKIDTADAEADYERLISDIEDAVKELEERIETLQHIYDKTIYDYEKRRDNAQENRDEWEEKVDNLENALERMELGDVEDVFDSKLEYEGEMKTQDDLEQLLRGAKGMYDSYYKAWDELDDKVNDLTSMGPGEMYDYYEDFEWNEKISFPNGEHDYDMDIPRIDDGRYNDYYIFAEDHYDGNDAVANQVIWTYVFEDQGWGDIKIELSKAGWYDPAGFGQ